jgi:hypothetical protein
MVYNEWLLTGNVDLGYSYVFAWLAEAYSSYAMTTNSQWAWWYAFVYGYWAWYYAGISHQDFQSAVSPLGWGMLGCYQAYVNFH